MTGFVVVVGVGADAITIDALRSSRAPDADDAQIVLQTAGLAIVTTKDLPARVTRDDCIVGEILAAGSASQPFVSLREQRAAGLDLLVARRSEAGGAPDDFALEHHYVAWDGVEESLLAARDSLGVRPIYHHWDGATLIVGSAVRWLLACGVPENPDPQSLRRFIAGRSLEADRTFIQGVRRLRPGHQLVFDGRRPCAREGSRRLKPPERIVADASEAAFRSRLEAAIGARLAAPDETCALLSGGLDSSAICMIAASAANRSGRRAPSTLSAVFDATPRWSERGFIEDVVAAAGLDARLLDLSQLGAFDDFAARLDELGGLFHAPGLYVGRAMYREARAAGRPVVLDGHGGDEVVSYGWDRFHELAMEGRWRLLLRELELGHVAGEPAAVRLWLLYWLKYGRLRRWVGRTVRVWRSIKRWLPCAPDTTGEGLVARTSDDPHVGPPPDADTRADELAPPIAARQHWAVVSDADQSTAMEVLHGAASAAGVVLRFPFWDRELVEFCLSLPADRKHRQGYTRWIMRSAVPELPDVVRWRRDKLDFTPHLALGMIRTHEAYLRELLVRPVDHPLWRVADRGTASRLIRSFVRRPSRSQGREVQAVWRLGALSLWFDVLAAREHAVASSPPTR